MTDPKWAKKELRRERLLKAVTAGVLIALAVGVLTIFQNRGQDQQITKIVQTPCQREPAGEECAAIRRAVALREPRANPCVSYQRVTGRKGRNCKRFYVRPESSGGPSFNAGAGDASEPVDSTSPSGDQDGSVQGGVGGGGNGSKPKGQAPASTPAAPAPTSTASAPANQSPGNSEGNGSSESSKANPVAEGVGGTVEGVGEVVKETGETVNGAVEGVTGKACGLVVC